MTPASRAARQLAVAMLVALAACSTTGQSAAGGESANASVVPASAPALPETLQGGKADTSRGMPVVPPPTSDTAGGRGEIARLEREARALAHTTGCSSASACRTAPVGSRACGGPRTYIVYCAASTDSVALFRKLAELERVEKAYIARSGMMSTCEFRMPPKAALNGGTCTEAPSTP